MSKERRSADPEMGPLRVVDGPETIRFMWVDPASLDDNPNNWRTHPESQSSFVRDTVTRVGWADTLLYNLRTKRLVNGHLRKKLALADPRMGPVPVLVGEWTEEQESIILARLDSSTEMATVDPVLLRRAVLADEEASEDAPEPIRLLMRRFAERKGVEFDDDDDDESGDGGGDAADRVTIGSLVAKWGTAKGQLWGIRSRVQGLAHFYMIGDSTFPGVVSRLARGVKFDMVATSPPYDLTQRDYDDCSTAHRDWDGLMQDAFAAAIENISDHAQVFINLGMRHDGGEWHDYWRGFASWMSVRGWRKFGWYVWDQQDPIPGDFHGRLAPCHEFVFHFNKEKRDPNRIKPNKVAGRVENSAGIRSPDGVRSRPVTATKYVTKDLGIPGTILRAARAISRGTAHLHPAIASPSLFRQIIEIFSSEGESVYDPFGGAGTTIQAADSVHRNAFVCEVSPAYAAVALESLTQNDLIPELLES